MEKTDVLIVGGGAIGCSIAFHLSMLGIKVILLERDTVGEHASGVAPGVLALGAHETVDLSMGVLCQDSMSLFPSLVQQLQEETGITCEMARTGILYLYLPHDEQDSSTSHTHLPWISDTEVHQMEPAITEPLRGGRLQEDGGHLTSKNFVNALALAAKQRGAIIETHTKVTGLLHDNHKVFGVQATNKTFYAEHVVLASGAWTSFLADFIKLYIPIIPLKGQVVHLYQHPQPFRHVIYVGDRYLVPRPDGTIVIGATLESKGFDLRATATAINWLLGLLPLLSPALSDIEFRRAIVGIRPCTTDDLPVIGSVADWQGLTVAAGHGRKGILLSPITGSIIANLLKNGTTTYDLNPFLPTRFLKEKNSNI